MSTAFKVFNFKPLFMNTKQKQNFAKFYLQHQRVKSLKILIDFSSHPFFTPPSAKVYPRQQMTHSARPSAAYVSETYMTTHRNSPNASVATTVNALPPAASMSDGRGERPPHPGAVAHSGHYPSQMPAFYYDPMTSKSLLSCPLD